MIDMTTMPRDTLLMLAAINFALCSAIGWACICRFSVMTKRSTNVHFRAGYTLLFVAAAASGFSPVLFREWPGPGAIAIAAATLYVLGTGVSNWRNGPPEYARSDAAPLDALPEQR